MTRSGTDWWPDFKKMLGIPELDVYFVPWLMDHTKLEIYHAGQTHRQAFGYVATAPTYWTRPSSSTTASSWTSSTP